MPKIRILEKFWFCWFWPFLMIFGLVLFDLLTVLLVIVHFSFFSFFFYLYLYNFSLSGLFNYLCFSRYCSFLLLFFFFFSFVFIFCLLESYWGSILVMLVGPPVFNRMGPMNSGPCVRVCVRPSVRASVMQFSWNWFISFFRYFAWS